MQAVLYTNDFEPITVVDISPWLWERLARGQHINIAVREPFRFNAPTETICESPKTVSIYGEVFRRRGKESMMIFTPDDENALLLRPEFLPGQRAEQQRRERGSFANGFLSALQLAKPL